MIKLTDILREIQEAKQVGILYHYTTYGNMERIIANNFILYQISNPYVSFTRSKNYLPDVPDDVRISIDGNSLSNKYKIKPYADIEGGYGREGWDEAEERINLEKYPQGIAIGPYIIEIVVKEIKNTVKSSSIDYYRLLETLKSKDIPYKLVKNMI